jgi:hypothetical protein
VIRWYILTSISTEWRRHVRRRFIRHVSWNFFRSRESIYHTGAELSRGRHHQVCAPICYHRFILMCFGSTSTVYALARNLGSVSNATAVFSFGFVQDPAVQFVDPTGSLQRRHPYFMTEYSSTAELVSIMTYSSFVKLTTTHPDRRICRRL